VTVSKPTSQGAYADESAGEMVPNAGSASALEQVRWVIPSFGVGVAVGGGVRRGEGAGVGEAVGLGVAVRGTSMGVGDAEGAGIATGVAALIAGALLCE
jgi:hypothetical protein